MPVPKYGQQWRKNEEKSQQQSSKSHTTLHLPHKTRTLHITQQLIRNGPCSGSNFIDIDLFTPQLNGTANLSLRHGSQINRQHIHRHAADNAATLSCHPNRRPCRHHARITVGITTSDDTNTGWCLCDKTSALANRLTRWQLTHCNHFTTQ